MDFEAIMGYVVTGIGGLLGGGGIMALFNWKENKSKAKEEVKSDEIENIKKSVEVYQTIISDLKASDADKTQRINELTAEIKQLREDKLQSELNYQRQIQNLQRQIVEITKALGIKANERVRDEKTGRYVKGE